MEINFAKDFCLLKHKSMTDFISFHFTQGPKVRRFISSLACISSERYSKYLTHGDQSLMSFFWGKAHTQKGVPSWERVNTFPFVTFRPFHTGLRHARRMHCTSCSWWRLCLTAVRGGGAGGQGACDNQQAIWATSVSVTLSLGATRSLKMVSSAALCSRSSAQPSHSLKSPNVANCGCKCPYTAWHHRHKMVSQSIGMDSVYWHLDAPAWVSCLENRLALVFFIEEKLPNSSCIEQYVWKLTFWDESAWDVTLCWRHLDLFLSEGYKRLLVERRDQCLTWGCRMCDG